MFKVESPVVYLFQLVLRVLFEFLPDAVDE